MKLLKILLWLLLLLQFPFLYSICQSRQLDRYLANLPRETVAPPPYRDLRGTIHVHSAAGGHSLGTYREIVEAAKQAHYQYLFITEHAKEFSPFARLFDPELVILYGTEEEREDSGRTLRSENSEVRILAYFDGPSIPDDVTGLELFNIYESAKAAQNVFAWVNWIYHQFSYGDLFFFHLLSIDEARFRAWDRATCRRQLAGMGGNDAHQNLGLIIQTMAGQKLLDLCIDPYLTSFRFLTNHLFVPYEQTPDEKLVLDALQKGCSYIAFERIADPMGFSFHAQRQQEVFPMGGVAPVGCDLVFQSPIPAFFRLIRNGDVYEELEGSRFVFATEESGTYRLEVFPISPPTLIENQPWIISNPIYVK